MKRKKGGMEPGWRERSRKGVLQDHAALKENKNELGKRGWTQSTLKQTLREAQLPTWWITMMLAAALEACMLPVLAAVEVFAGQGELCSAIEELVGCSAMFEVKRDPRHNILKREGLFMIMVLVLRIVRGGLLWLGTPCQSWIILSRSWTRRTRFRPQGPLVIPLRIHGDAVPIGTAARRSLDVISVSSLLAGDASTWDCKWMLSGIVVDEYLPMLGNVGADMDYLCNYLGLQHLVNMQSYDCSLDWHWHIVVLMLGRSSNI